MTLVNNREGCQVYGESRKKMTSRFYGVDDDDLVDFLMFARE